MTKEYWVEAALKNDTLVVELLLRMKHSSDSLHAPPPPPPSSSITPLLPPSGWGNRKNRSKSTPSNTTGKDQRGSPTTHLSWSGASTSDGYEESNRPSDPSSGARSIKANEGASTSGCNKSHKRKSIAELKEEEGSLLKERIHIDRELASMRLNLNQQMATSQNLKRVKIDFDQNPRNKHEASPALVQISCSVEAESEAREKGFVLPDLNMPPNEEDLAMMS